MSPRVKDYIQKKLAYVHKLAKQPIDSKPLAELEYDMWEAYVNLKEEDLPELREFYPGKAQSLLTVFRAREAVSNQTPELPWDA